MSSRYVLIEFDDKEAALKLKGQIDKATRAGKPFRVVGYFAKPEAPYCMCGREVTEATKASSLIRNEKSGLYKCKLCGLYSNLTSPKNLLKLEKVINPPTYQGKHYRTGEVVEWVHHFLTLTALGRLVPVKAQDVE